MKYVIKINKDKMIRLNELVKHDAKIVQRLSGWTDCVASEDETFVTITVTTDRYIYKSFPTSFNAMLMRTLELSHGVPLISLEATLYKMISLELVEIDELRTTYRIAIDKKLLAPKFINKRSRKVNNKKEYYDAFNNHDIRWELKKIREDVIVFHPSLLSGDIQMFNLVFYGNVKDEELEDMMMNNVPPGLYNAITELQIKKQRQFITVIKYDR